jgi:N utilization substance protein B
MQALYAREMAEDDSRDYYIQTVIQPELQDDGVLLEFAKKLFRTTIATTDEADTVIAKHAENWEVHRINPVDRCLLRMATAELLEFEEIPPKVSIDEAIDIAKKYSTPRSGNFINGVLDSILMDLERQDRLHKTGRGLVGIDSIRDRARS